MVRTLGKLRLDGRRFTITLLALTERLLKGVVGDGQKLGVAESLLDFLTCYSLGIIRSLSGTVDSFGAISLQIVGYQLSWDSLICNLSLLYCCLQLLWSILYHPFSSLSDLIFTSLCSNSRCCSYRHLWSIT